MRFRLNLGAVWELKRAVELGSVTKAAEELGLSQPALTRRIKQLEHDLGVDVLVRDHAGVKPTELGAMILRDAQALFDQVHRLEEKIAVASGRLSGEVSVCLPTSMQRMVTRPFLKMAAAKMPEVRIRLIDAFDTVLHEQLVRGQADVGIIIHGDGDTGVPGVRLEPLAIDPLFLIGRDAEPGERAPIRVADMDKLTLVLPSQGNGLRRKIDAACRRARIKPRIIEVDSFRATNDVVHSGEALSVTPSCGLMSGDALWWSPITRLSIGWALAIRESRSQSMAVQTVSDLLRQQVSLWLAGSTWARRRETVRPGASARRRPREHANAEVRRVAAT